MVANRNVVLGHKNSDSEPTFKRVECWSGVYTLMQTLLEYWLEVDPITTFLVRCEQRSGY